MTESFARSLDALGAWRTSLEARLRELGHFLREHDLLDGNVGELLDSLRARLSAEKLVVAFVAEFSRGKSELINAIFFADAGRRIMPASPGRTTMCPVELGWDPDEPPGLSLLPIETRLEGAALADLRGQRQAWVREPLNIHDPENFAQALTAVMRTREASVEDARALGFWNDEQPQDNPRLLANGHVEIPAWRHALINVPHPLLKRGLVVIDTPGLNAIGAEPELTVGLLPSAHATVFILGADTGVTKSDLAIWRDHLSVHPLSRYVALNKIDALVDPLSTLAHTEAQIDEQVRQVAGTLEISPDRVFPISARQALAGRVAGSSSELERSRLPALENALSQQLLPQRREMLEEMTLDALAKVQRQVGRNLTDPRRQLAEQLMELRGLRGKNSSKVELMLRRVNDEASEFEQCVTQLQAMRAVHARMLKAMLMLLAGDKLRTHLETMQNSIRESLLKMGARRAFVQMCSELRELLTQAGQRSVEIHEMLNASFSKLNAQFGFGLSLPAVPDLSGFETDLGLIERNYVQYLGLGQALRLGQPRFMEQFRRMLLSRLRVVFESASGELELWNKTASAQVDAQLRERRRAFKRRRESLERIQVASGELESRLEELQAHDQRLASIETRVAALMEQAARAARETSLEPVVLESLPRDGGLPPPDTEPAPVDLDIRLLELPEIKPPPDDRPVLPVSSALPSNVIPLKAQA
jgi:hypothetical protein